MRLHRIGDAGANGFGYFCQNKSDMREARKLCFCT